MKYDYLSAAELSDVGRQRRRNEDKTLVLAEHGVYGVFDGMGGAAGGGEASEAAADAVRRKFAEHAAQPTGLSSLKGKVITVRSALNEASREIRERADAQGVAGSGTTAVVLIFDAAQPQRAIILHAGDSRAYRYRAGQLIQLTRDHSFAVAAGVASERSLPPMFRGVVTRAVGLEREVVLEETLVDAAAGDTFMLCTDGITKMMADGAIVQTFERETTRELAPLAAVLIEEANTAGGHDNASVVLVGVAGFVMPDATSKTAQPGTISAQPSLLVSKPVTEEFSNALAERAAAGGVVPKKSAGGKIAFLLLGALAVIVGVFWLNSGGTATPSGSGEPNGAQPVVIIHPPAPGLPAAQLAQAKNTEPVKPLFPIVPPPALPPAKTEPVPVVSKPTVVVPMSLNPPVIAKQTQAVEMAMTKPPVAPPATIAPPPKTEVVISATPSSAPVIPKTQVASTQTPVVPPPPKVETPAPPPRQPVRTPEAIAAAQANMEMLMMDVISALSNGHWSFVEETIAEWSPTAPYESAALGAWPVYRDWSAVWREASTGQRSAAELYEPYRAKISDCLHELGCTSGLAALQHGKDARADADELCRARYDAQNKLLDEMRRSGEETARLSDMLQKGKLMATAAQLRRAANHIDIAAIGDDLDARARTLVASTRDARGNPAPMSADEIAATFAGWTSLRVGEEKLWTTLIDIIRDADVRSLGDSAHRKELNALREKIAVAQKKNDNWNVWLSGDGPADVIKFLVLAQSQMKQAAATGS